MELLRFSLGFTLIHIAAYMLAGMLAFRMSRDLYNGQQRLLDFITDMSAGGLHFCSG